MQNDFTNYREIHKDTEREGERNKLIKEKLIFIINIYLKYIFTLTVVAKELSSL